MDVRNVEVEEGAARPHIGDASFSGVSSYCLPPRRCYIGFLLSLPTRPDVCGLPRAHTVYSLLNDRRSSSSLRMRARFRYPKRPLCNCKITRSQAPLLLCQYPLSKSAILEPVRRRELFGRFSNPSKLPFHCDPVTAIAIRTAKEC